MRERRTRAYAANHHTLKSKNIKKSAKMQIYKVMLRPVVTYGSETWTLTESEFLKDFRKESTAEDLRPIQKGDVWIIRNNEELNRSINGEDIVKFIKGQRIRRLGHAKSTEVGAMPRKMMEGRLLIRRRQGRPRLRWMMW